ncbi:ABC transporter substrate-binding protein [Salinivibrio sp. IB574]|uniref:endolytic transglycosylase MltG n=1 Tax=Salinivibrio sp. IB574 TaxID=1909444 RepID=UPI00098969BC|nr:endolytic transglycosylase MltG [Salinivibrio sp. IB574]OOF23089.1 ABC transporter substrate-binding protein [Salinivibrio sp. IB574]
MLKKRIFGLISLFMCLLVALAGWTLWQTKAYVASPLNLESPQLVTIAKGAHYHKVINQFEDKGWLTATVWAKVAPRVYPELTRIQAGTFQIQPGQSLAEVFATLREGQQYQDAITFIEGSTFAQWRLQMASAPHLEQTLTALDEADIAKRLGAEYTKLEGLLLPETYAYDVGDTDLSLLRRAYQAMQASLDKAWQNRADDLPIDSPYELLILASIIEKETAIDAERTKVASVFVNRLRRGMRLQTDPTVIYGMGDNYDGNIRKRDLRTPTPYNTYVIKGLPPTPIAMPGMASLMAAAQPATTQYYYFVATGKGGHQFSTTLAEHNRAVRDYLKVLKSQ